MKILLIDRISLSNPLVRSRSIGARTIPLLDELSTNHGVMWTSVLDSEFNEKCLNGCSYVLFNTHTSFSGLEIINAAKSKGVKVIYDLDDWMFGIPSYSTMTLSIEKLSNITEMIRLADIVTTSNERLLERLSEICSHAIVVSNGSLIDNNRKHNESSNPKILFSTTDNLKMRKYYDNFFRQLREFIKLSNATIDFWGDEFKEISSLPNVNHRGVVSYSEYREKLCGEQYWFSVVPLGGEEDGSDYAYNRCKTAIKYFDYASLGIPGIYSDVEIYSKVVKNEKTGILVKNDDNHWLDAMMSLYLNSAKREELRREAFIDCSLNYNLANSAAKFFNVLAR